MTDQLPETPKIKPEDNPWYLLATLYGQPAVGPYGQTTARDHELHLRNRIAWNRYIAAERNLPSKVAPAATPFTPEEMPAIELAFAKRRPLDSTASAEIPRIHRSSPIDFSNVEFNRGPWFNNFVFPTECDFSNASFSEGADFGGAIFVGSVTADGMPTASATFYGATFAGSAYFQGATFADTASFYGATFGGSAYFQGATFADTASFKRATFAGLAGFRDTTFFWVSFDGAIFADTASFERANFTTVSFQGTTFSGLASFDGATFKSETSFVNAEMKDETSFEAAIFITEPPRFFGTKLHEGTEWGEAKWPSPPRDALAARRFVLAYERLKLEMDRLKKHNDELDFFAREQQCRRVLLGFFGGLPIAVYSFLSDYGRSYVRPFWLLVALVILGAMPFALCPSSICFLSVQQAIGISFANTFSVFGKPLVKPDVLLQLPDWLKAVSTLQTILGIVLLFLLGLGIRNRFRMK